MNVVLDTCALLWLTLAPSELSGRAQKAISKAEQLLVSSISIWEIGVKQKRGRLDLGTTFEDYVERVTQSENIEVQAVDVNLWVRTVTLEWEHRDPADRAIVALATLYDLPLITDDNVIAEFYKKTVF